jgi:hypothetical protein
MPLVDAQCDVNVTAGGDVCNARITLCITELKLKPGMHSIALAGASRRIAGRITADLRGEHSTRDRGIAPARPLRRRGRGAAARPRHSTRGAGGGDAMKPMPAIKRSQRDHGGVSHFTPLPKMGKAKRVNNWDPVRWTHAGDVSDVTGTCGRCSRVFPAIALKLHPAHVAFGHDVPDQWVCTECDGRQVGKPGGVNPEGWDAKPIEPSEPNRCQLQRNDAHVERTDGLWEMEGTSTESGLLIRK